MSTLRSRRSVLRASGTALLLGSAGCSAFAASGDVTVGVVNSTDRLRRVHVEIHRDDDLHWAQDADVAGGASVVTERALSDVAEGAKLRVRAWLRPKERPESSNLTMREIDEDAEEWVTVRVEGNDDDAWLDVTA